MMNSSAVLVVCRSFVCMAVIVTVMSLGVNAASADDKRDKTWLTSLKTEFFEDVDILDGSAFMSLEAPKRAEDAAVVPIKLTVAPGKKVNRLVLFVDENPIPMAADFTFGPKSPTASFSTRLRVNSYSYVRVVAQADDGKHYMIKKFVKASGGCSAPANKDLEAAMAQLGKMKLRLFQPTITEQSSAPQSGVREAQIIIRHPNNSGFQMDQITMLYIPAHFVDLIEVRQDNELVMKVEGGISLSENPNLRFYYRESGAGTISVRATDNNEGEFNRSWSTTGS